MNATTYTPREVFTMIVERMEADNGCLFAASRVHLANALAPIHDLMVAGYFQDDPAKLEDSFWQAAAGEEAEAREFFSRAPAAYEHLSNILNHIFEGPLAARYTHGERLRRTVPGMDPDHFHVLEYLTREPDGEVTITRIPLAEWPAWAEGLRRELHPLAFAPRPAIHRPPDTLQDALTELREAWDAFREPLLVGFVQAWRDLFRLLNTPLRFRRRPSLKWTAHGRDIDAAALRQMALFFIQAADQMECGQLVYKSGGVIIDSNNGRTATIFDGRVELEERPCVQDWAKPANFGGAPDS